MDTPDSKADKLASRLQDRIAAGQFYEAQQQTRVVAARYIKAGRFADAADLLAGQAQALLRAGQGGSAGDLCVMLVTVYNQAGWRPDPVSRGRLLACLRLIDPAEPTRRDFISSMLDWSAKFGGCAAGDAELHHVVGALYAEERESYEAERHLLLGTRDSAETLARLEYSWYGDDDDRSTAASYLARAVLPSLVVGNMRAATTAHRIFTTALAADSAGAHTEELQSAKCSVRIFSALPLLNFLSLLLLAVQRGVPELFHGLQARYGSQLAQVPSWKEALDAIGEMYFGISRPRQGNPLIDMMGSLFGGGPAASKAGRRRIGDSTVEPIAPEGLD